MSLTIEKMKKFSNLFVEREDIKVGTELKKLSKPVSSEEKLEEVIREFRFGEEDL
ncbi:MAG: hypothetical protein ACOC1V_05360 [Candidatus Saliniplasma sp.]